MPFVSRTRATFRSAEFGFFGVAVYTRVQTPRRCGAARRRLRPCPDLRPGVATFFFGLTRPLRTSWLMLGMAAPTLARRRGASPCSNCARAWGWERRAARGARRAPKRVWGGPRGPPHSDQCFVAANVSAYGFFF